MSLSLQKKLPRTTLFFLQLFGAVFLVHLILFFIAAFLLRASGLSEIYVRSSYLNQANLVVMPYMRTVGKKTLQRQSGNRRGNNTKRVASPPKPVVKKKLAAKIVTKKIAAKKELVKKAMPKPAPKPAVKPVVTPEPKKEPIAKPIAKPEPLKAEPAKAVPVKAEPVKAVAKSESIAETVEPVQIGRNDLEAMQLHDGVASAIYTKWHPPLGIEPSRPCTLTITVSPRGVVDGVSITEGSGVLAYDLAARMAVMQAEFPKVAFGQSFSVHL